MPQFPGGRNAEDDLVQDLDLRLAPYGSATAVPRGRKGLHRALLAAQEDRASRSAADLDRYRREAVIRAQQAEDAAFAELVRFTAAEAATGYLARVAAGGDGVDVVTANPGEELAPVISLDDLRARRARRAG